MGVAGYREFSKVTVQHPEARNGGVPFPLFGLKGQGDKVAAEPRGHEEKATWQEMSH